MERASKTELAKRINRAFLLLKNNLSSQQIILTLQKEFGVSEIQAYRYVQQAKKSTSLLPVPESTKIFTTKLAYSLIHRVRAFSKLAGIPITQVISQALETYLKQAENGQKEE